jgi:uncharacterized protein (DUF2147 family)
MRKNNGWNKKGLLLVWAFLSMSCLFANFARADGNTDAIKVSALGNWEKLNPATKQPVATIQITLSPDNTLVGKVIKVNDPEQNKTTCQDCPDSFKNQPIEGMEVLWGLKQASDYTWNNGHILTPKRGKIFSCNLTISEDGQTLTVRVYSVTAILGHTETWYRV